MTRATTLEFPRPTLNSPDPKTLAAEILKSLNYMIGKNAAFATEHDWLTASISVVRDRVVERWLEGGPSDEFAPMTLDGTGGPCVPTIDVVRAGRLRPGVADRVASSASSSGRRGHAPSW